MSFLQSSTIQTQLVFTQIDRSLEEISIIDQGNIVSLAIFGSGTGTSKLSTVFYTGGFLATGTQLFDLFNLSRNIFGSIQTINFSGGKVKVFHLKNQSSEGTLSLYITGSDTFQLNFLGGSGISLLPSGFYSATNPYGWSINTGNRYFYLNNNLTGQINYELALLGN